MTEKNKKTNWKTTDKRFVAFLDLLGFKDKVMRKSHNDIYNELNKISSIKKSIENLASDDFITNNFDDVDIYIVSFSDSIVLFSKNDNIDNFNFFISALSILFSKAIFNKIALKGGIAHGTISVNKSEQIYFGQPIIDAYLIEEDVNYLGVVCHNSIDAFLKNNLSDPTIVIDFFKFIETPLKCGNINHYILDWYILLLVEDKNAKKSDDNAKIKFIQNVLEKFYETVSGSPRRYVDNSIKLLQKMHAESLINLDFSKLK